MRKRRSLLSLAFFLVLLGLLGLLGYKIYLSFFKDTFEALHAQQIERIEARLQGREAYSFAVVGNVRNSIGVFERRMIPALNRSGVDFLVSAGNVVSGGGEDNYQALYGSMRRLRIPYVLTFAGEEESEFGSFRFYDMFGPYFYSFSAGGARFIFLDVTGKTPLAWQLRWFEDELEATRARGERAFVFLGEPVLPAQREREDVAHGLARHPDFIRDFLSLVDDHDVEAVFTASEQVLDRRREGETLFVATGGGGGLLLGGEDSFYHFLQVDVDGQDMAIEPVKMQQAPGRLLRMLEGLWFLIYSLFYVGYLNFLLVVCVVVLVAIRLYKAVFMEKNYYRDFSDPSAEDAPQPLRVVMFTNNYLPFIGGVPISIQRLAHGLQRQGGRVLVVAPEYGTETDEEGHVLRVPSLLHWGRNGDFRLANVLSTRIAVATRAFRPNVIHVHHPFWLGSLGLFIGRGLRIPVVFTYHTRLEQYAHYVPLPGLLFRNFIAHYLVEHFANKCDGVVVPTYSAEEYLHVIGVRSQILVRPTGVDCEAMQQADPGALERLRREHGGGGETLLVSVSRLGREKNIDFMLEGLAWVRRHSSAAFRLLMVGDGPERPRLERRVTELGLQDCVELVGSVAPADIPAYYQICDAFVFASKSETQGMVILEAMAAGLPVVAVRASGIDDVVQDGVNGYKTPEDVAEWGGSVIRLLEDEQGRKDLAARARAFARDYDVLRVSEDVAGFYRRLMALNARRVRSG
ncbi:MAG: glycosyltransferase [Ectothiorhodospira sp.]